MVTGQRPVSPILASLESQPDAPLAASHGREIGLLYSLTGETSLNL